jgi:hypothetical protein
MPSERLHALALVLTCLTAGSLVGCDAFQRTRVETTILESHPGELDDFEFWDDLAQQPVVSNDDALHALILMNDGRDPSTDFEGRTAIAAEKGWLQGTHLPLDANESASVGLLSVAGCRILDIQGGLTMSLLGPSPRYCTRELVAMGILPGLTANEALSGLEFIAFIDGLEARDRLQRAWQRRDEVTKGDDQ